MDRAAIFVQRAWRRRRLRRALMWLRGTELVNDSERRHRYSMLTDALLDGEHVFNRQCACYDALARRWNLPGLEELDAIPYD